METKALAKEQTNGSYGLHEIRSDLLVEKTICRSALHQRTLGAAYMLGMVVLGIVVIGMETNLVDIAELCGVSVQTVSFSLITRSIGSVLGSFSSAFLMLHLPPHHLVFLMVLLMGLLLAAIPFITNDKVVDGVFFGFGYGIPVTQAAIQFLTCQVFQDGAGPWLQGNSLAMSVGTVIVPVVHYSEGMVGGYLILATLTIAFAIMGFVTPQPCLQKEGASTGSEKGGESKGSANQIDFCIGWMLFWLAGCIVQTTSYLKSYVPQADLEIPVETDLMLTIFMIFCILGQLVALRLQQEMTLSDLHLQMSLLFGFGLLSMVTVLTFSHSTTVLWISICLYGFCVGPLYGYVFDLWNRSSEVTEIGSAIVIFGVAGSGLFSYLTHSLWVYLDHCSVLMIVNGLGFVVAWLILFYITKQDPKKSFGSPRVELEEGRLSGSSADWHYTRPTSPEAIARSALLSVGSAIDMVDGSPRLIRSPSIRSVQSPQSPPSPRAALEMREVGNSRITSPRYHAA